MAYNKYLDGFLMFYSQSDAGNGLTRGLETELARKTYVRTRLDTDLAPAILKGRFRLVILTGNAGDGKTAFIQMVEKSAERLGAIINKIDSIGSTFEVSGKTFRTIYDGSVDAREKANLDMLSDFFKPFEGEAPGEVGERLIIAMNEGKLRDFLSNSTKHPWLSSTLFGHLLKGAPLPKDIVVVNLNLRSIVHATNDLSNCLFDNILDRYVANEFWSNCDSCVAWQKCPVKFDELVKSPENVVF